MTWKGLPDGTRNWIALGGAVCGVLGAVYGFGAKPTADLTAQVNHAVITGDSAWALAKQNRADLIRADAARDADSERLRRMDRTLCRISGERPLSECEEL